jgi:nucleoid-associated protein YgaU
MAETKYKVVGGDSLSSIAQKFYGSADLWKVIYDANRQVIGSDPNLIHPGTELTIPDRGTGGGDDDGDDGDDGGTGEVLATYTVVQGDTLSDIAQRFYGNGDQEHVRIIFRANKKTIGNDRRVIKPGQVLKIPKI